MDAKQSLINAALEHKQARLIDDGGMFVYVVCKEHIAYDLACKSHTRLWQSSHRKDLFYANFGLTYNGGGEVVLAR